MSAIGQIESTTQNRVVRLFREQLGYRYLGDNLISHLLKITKQDCEFIDGLMTKYSCYEHSQSHETPTFLPDEPELRQDVEALKFWRDKFKRRSVEANA